RSEMKAAAAAIASGAFRPLSAATKAPAPRKSSSAGRSVPFGHRSPAAITPISPPWVSEASATAAALRRHPAKHTEGDIAWAIIDPLGEGNTRRIPAAIVVSSAADSVYRAPEPRRPATSAPSDPA